MSMIPTCSCIPTFTVQNLGGFETCSDGMGIIRGAVFMNEELLGGGVNGIPLTTIPNQTFFDLQTLNPIIQDRWANMTGIKNYDAPVVAPEVEEIDGSKFTGVQDGKTVTWQVITRQAPKLKAKLDSIVACRGDVLVMLYDAKGNMSGEATATHLIGRKIQKGSYNSQVQELVRGAESRLIVTFTWDESALEGAVDYIDQDVMEGFKAERDFTDLIDGRISYGTSTLVDIPFDIFSDVGGVTSKNPLGSLETAHLVAEDITAPASPIDVPGTVSESPDGSYIFTYTSAISSGKRISIRPIGWDLGTPNYLGLTYDLKDLVLQQAPDLSA